MISRTYSIPTTAMTTALRRWPNLSTSARAPQSATSAFAFTRSLSRTPSAMAPQAKFAEGSDEAALGKELSSLVSGRWSLTEDGQGIERLFKFKTFAKTWDFMTAVSLQCKLKNHHPEWSNVYNTMFIRWTTHSPPGLSGKDTSLASICDALAKDFGEIQEQRSAEDVCQLKGLADKMASTAGDCCVPKK